MTPRQECTCQPFEWFRGKVCGTFTLTCPVHGSAQPGIIPVEMQEKPAAVPEERSATDEQTPPQPQAAS